MPDTEAIVRIYGAIDHAAQADLHARHRIARLLPQYKDPEFHWYDDFRKWLADTGGEQHAGPARPDPAEALKELAEPASHPRMRARRMFAVALTARAFEKDDELTKLAVAAIKTPPGDPVEIDLVTPEEEDVPDADLPADPDAAAVKRARENAERLYELLADPAAQPVVHREEDGTERPALMRPPVPRTGVAEPSSTRHWWGAVIAKALEDNLIDNPTGMFPAPCAGRVLTLPGVDGPVAAIETDHETKGEDITFHLATRFIEPSNWHTCMPGFWCEMEAMDDPRLPKGQKRYREVVSTHCRERAPGFWARTDLLFNFWWVPDKDNPVAAIANYELAAGRPLPHDRIVVDEGTLVVSKVGDDEMPLRITTTKRVKFSRSFPSGALAMIVCALGYADLSGNLLACASTHGKALTDKLEQGEAPYFVRVGDGATVGHEFPGIPANVAAANAAANAGGSVGYGQGRAAGLVQDTMSIWARAMRDGARAVERSTYRSGG